MRRICVYVCIYDVYVCCMFENICICVLWPINLKVCVCTCERECNLYVCVCVKKNVCKYTSLSVYMYTRERVYEKNMCVCVQVNM